MLCLACSKEIDSLTAFNGRCGKCHGENLKAKATNISVEELRSREKLARSKNTSHGEANFRNPTQYQKIVLTTEATHNLEISERVEIISSEVVVGMNILKDLFAGVRNVVGGRSQSIQNALRDIRIQALDELKREAFKKKADAVVGVNLSYQEIGATGSTMLFVVATGTAVRLKQKSESTENHQ